IKEYILKEIESPSIDFVKAIISGIYDGHKTQTVIEKFTPIVKKSFNQIFNETVNNRLTAAITKDDEPEEDEIEKPTSKIVTTEEEIQSYMIVKGILAGSVNLEDVVYRDTESYFGILFQNNNRKPICRLNLDAKKKHIMIPDENKNFTRYNIESLDDIYKYKDLLIESATRYM
ncbi:MAG: endonuclease, partial [Lachnospiraceae bacterium]|nr:endonuclease [Lachnospiraceae bacterium]